MLAEEICRAICVSVHPENVERGLRSHTVHSGTVMLEQVPVKGNTLKRMKTIVCFPALWQKFGDEALLRVIVGCPQTFGHVVYMCVLVYDAM